MICNNKLMSKLKILQDKGLRITSQREVILKSIQHKPKTADEIYSVVRKKNASIDLASVYRNVQVFAENNLVHEIDFGDGVKRYEKVTEKNHHHHVVCNNCGKVKDITLKHENKLIKEASMYSLFNITRHSLEFFGICKKCQ